MAFGIVLWVSCISLLFRCTSVSAGNGIQYRPSYAATNLMDDHHDLFNTLSFDEGNLDEEGSTEKPTSAFYASFNKPSVREPQHLAPPGQRIPEHQNIPNLAIFSRESNLVEPITFPLNQGNQMTGLTPSKPAFVQPQANPVNAFAGPSGTGSSGLLMHFKPSRTSTSFSFLPQVQSKQPATPASGESATSLVHYIQPNTVSSPSNLGSKEQFFAGVFNFNTGDAGSSSAGDPTPQQHFPYYPSKPSKPSQSYPPLDTGRWSSESNDIRPSIGDLILQRNVPRQLFLNPETQWSGQSNSIDPGTSGYATPSWKAVDEDWMFSFFPEVFDNLNTDFLHSSYQPKNSASVQMDKVSKVYQPTGSFKPLKKRIVHSKNGYKRGRFVTSKTAYTPEYQMAQIKDTMDLKPIQRQPRKWPPHVNL